MGGGLKSGEGAIVLATAEPLEALERRLADSGLDVAAAQSQDQYISLVAEEALGKFMVNQWPDEKLFARVDRACAGKRSAGPSIW